MRLATLIIAALLVPSASAQAQKWVEVGKTSSGNPVYVDPKTVKKADGIVNGTIRVRFLTPVKAGAKEFKSSRTLVMGNCAKKTVASKESIYFTDVAGTVVGQRTVNAKPGFGSPIKGTASDVALTYLCSR